MSYINETDFVIENKEIVYPEIITDGLQLYYDAKGKRDTDYHRDTMLDMSGNKNHGKLHNFSYEKHSGYKDGLVFDYIDDKLTMPKLNGINANNFTYQLNNNILAFTGDEVKTVKNGNIEVVRRNLLKGTSDSFKEINPRTRFTPLPENSITPISEYGLEVGDTITFRIYIQAHNSVPVNARITPYFTGGSYSANTGNRIQAGEEGYSTVTYTIPSNVDRLEVGLDVPVPAGNTSILMYYKEAKLEKGNKATDWIPAPEYLIKTTELKGNILGDMEGIIDGLYKTEVLSGQEIYTDKADDAVVHVEVDGKSYQHAGTGKNLFDIRHHKYSSTVTPNEWGGFDRSGGAGGFDASDIKVEPNQTYTFSYKVEYGTARQEIYDGDGSILYILGTDSNVSFTPKHSTIRIHMSHYSGAKYLDSRITEIQLEKGSTATEYEPPAQSPDYPVEIHSLNDFDVVSQKSEGGVIDGIEIGGRNLIPTFIDARWSIPPSISIEGKYTISQPTTENAYIDIDVETNTEYTYTFNSDYARSSISGYIDGIHNETVFHLISGSFVNTFNSGDNNQLRINISKYSREDRIATTRNLKLEKGNKATDWTPAPEDITESDNHPLIDKINLLLDEPLRSVGDVKDRLFRDSDGLWKIERKVTSFEVDENNIGVQSTGDDFIRFIIGHPIMSTSNSSSNGFSSTHMPYGRNMDGTPEINNGGGNYTVFVWLKKSSLPTPDLEGFRNWISSQRNNGTPFIIQYEIIDYVTETLSDELQDKLNNLRSFQDSNYVYTVINDKTDNLSDYVADNLKPTLHAKFLYNNWYKEDRVINNLMIYNRALTNEEMLQNYKTIKRRWGM